MMTFKIMICAELKDEKLVSALKAATEPPQIELEFSDKTDGSMTEFPEDRGTHVITDDIERIHQLSKLARHNLRLIFVGDAKLTDELDDVWNTSDPEEVKARFERLLKRTENEMNAWFYEQTLYTTIDSVPDMLWFKRLDGIHTMVNKAFTEVVHKKREDIIGRDHFYIWDAPRPAEGNEFACAESEETAISTGKMYVCDEPVKTREGMKQLTTYKTPIYDMFGNVFGTVGVGHDVTNFSNLGIELSILVENLPFPMIIFTADMKVVRMNEAFMEIAEITKDEIADFDYKAWSDFNLTPVGDKKCDEKKHLTTQEFTMFRQNKTWSYIINLQEVRDFFNNISGYFIIIEDITFRRAYEESILKAANTDMLTGMYNRRYFYNYLTDHSYTKMTLFYMDLDRFKYVNDNYGHAKGDEVLIKTANAIRTLFPNSVSARLGGDEFALVMEGILDEKTVEEYRTVLERTIQRIFIADGIPVTMSVGIATHSGENMDVDKFMHMGDKEMYAAKQIRYSGEPDNR